MLHETWEWLTDITVSWQLHPCHPADTVAFLQRCVKVCTLIEKATAADYDKKHCQIPYTH